MPLVTAADMYGSGGKRIVGVRSETTGINASGSVGNEELNSPNTNASFSWLIFVLVLVFIRVLEEFTPNG